MSAKQIDISNDTQSVYHITKAGEYSFFAKNRTGNITFEIVASNAHLCIAFLFEGKASDRFVISTTQHHQAPESSSKLVVKSVLSDKASLDHRGIIRIESPAQQTEASFESRHLLMNAGAGANAQPHLEILADDVRCSHSATISPPNKDLVFFLQSRGIETSAARRLIASGFLQT
jgi:Fe-S cluster assembly scaffold protein SufB